VGNFQNSESTRELKVGRAGFIGLLAALLRPGDAGAVSLNSRGVVLEWFSKSLAIGFGQIESVDADQGWLGHSVQLRFAHGSKAVSGLSRTQAKVLVDQLEIGRTLWWQGALRAHAPGLHSVSEQISSLSSPTQYMRLSLFSTLERDATEITHHFPGNWPVELPGTDKIGQLSLIRNFLAAPDAYRSQANQAFLNQELIRSKSFLDKVEARPLTSEQRKAVVVDEDRNLVVAAAGSGKTSVIVGKAGWLVERGFRTPSEILLLAYAKDAQEEMKGRVGLRLGAETAADLTVQTFHGFGLSIIGEAEGKRPSLAKVAEDNQAFFDLLKEILAELLEDPKHSKLMVTWFQNYFAPYRNETEFRTQGEYWNYIRSHEIRSLQGEKLKSYEECEIANFLFLNGIAYEYERSYEHETATRERRQYQPDFYLTEAKIYIEHFALSASGDTPPFINKEEYLKSREWKLALHKAHETVLIETFSYEKSAGRLTENLAEKLRTHGVELNPIPPADMFETLMEQGRVDPFTRFLATFIQHFKGAQLSIDVITRRAAGMRDHQRAQAFIKIFEPIYRKYEGWLAKHEQIDFHDMILRATEHVEKGLYVSPHDYILVDEFQDISPDRARLLKAILDRSSTAQLFAVGDDWQSIYRFAGSDIAVMREFTERFGVSERVDLTTTFRCAEGVASAATKFILRNPAQLHKDVCATFKYGGPAINIGLSMSSDSNLLVETLNAISADAAKAGGRASVLLLGRYRHSKPKELARVGKLHPNLDLSYVTVHRSKGLEADYVIVVGLSSGKYGFPTEITDDPLLDLVLATPEGHPNAEERRLFYVAMTRAKRRIFLLCEDRGPSPFIKELLEDGYDVSVFGTPLDHNVACPTCVEGSLERRNGSNGVFYGCSNWPYCDYTQAACPHCSEGLPIKRANGYSCSSCEKQIESCVACDGWMRKRSGKYGLFWGCSNWPTCNYTRSFS